MKKLLGLIALILSSQVFASTYSGTISAIQIQNGLSGATRVSIYTGTTTSCGISGWYAFEYASMTTTGPGPAWFAAAMLAKLLEESIWIDGTGTCDYSGVETLSIFKSN